MIIETIYLVAMHYMDSGVHWDLRKFDTAQAACEEAARTGHDKVFLLERDAADRGLCCSTAYSSGLNRQLCVENKDNLFGDRCPVGVTSDLRPMRCVAAPSFRLEKPVDDR